MTTPRREAFRPSVTSGVVLRQRGQRAERHGATVAPRRAGGTHLRPDDSPREVAVLAWAGIEPGRAPAKTGAPIRNPETKPERHVGAHVSADPHGADPSAGPAPTLAKVAQTGAEVLRQSVRGAREEQFVPQGRARIPSAPWEVAVWPAPSRRTRAFMDPAGAPDARGGDTGSRSQRPAVLENSRGAIARR